MGEKKRPNNRSDSSSNNLNENKHDGNRAADMKAFQRSSSATDMKVFQRISGALDTETFQRISSATDGEPGKDGESRKKNVLWD